MTPANILIVEDESLIAQEIAVRLRRFGYSVGEIVDNARDALTYVQAVRPDMALVDIHIKGPMTGIQLAQHLREEHNVPVIFLTAHADAGTLREATATEPFGYIVKPFDARSLAATLETALRRRRAEQKLARMERWLAATMSSIGDGVLATDEEYRVSFINPVAERLCGWLDGSALGRPITEVFRLVSEDCIPLASAIEEASVERVVVHFDRCHLQSRDGELVPIDDSMAPIRDERGRVSGVVIVFRDATQRRRYEQQLRNLNAGLEEQVQLRTAQLQAANVELASFSYSIAHDLRAPLRAIIGFSSRVVEDHARTLEPEGRRLLEVVTSQAAQMSRMIDDYLRLSGLSQVGLTRTHLDMTQLAREAWNSVTAGLAHPPHLTLEELPHATADHGLLRQVWVNLLSNAVKFSRSATAPSVRVTGTQTAREVRYVIEDNGVGFDPAHGSKAFRVFERLHNQQEFEGNGVGLCIVQRIIHRHEGDVAITAMPNAGARVEFWLPRSAAAASAPEHVGRTGESSAA